MILWIRETAEIKSPSCWASCHHKPAVEDEEKYRLQSTRRHESCHGVRCHGLPHQVDRDLAREDCPAVQRRPVGKTNHRPRPTTPATVRARSPDGQGELRVAAHASGSAYRVPQGRRRRADWFALLAVKGGKRIVQEFANPRLAAVDYLAGVLMRLSCGEIHAAAVAPRTAVVLSGRVAPGDLLACARKTIRPRTVRAPRQFGASRCA